MRLKVNTFRRKSGLVDFSYTRDTIEIYFSCLRATPIP